MPWNCLKQQQIVLYKFAPRPAQSGGKDVGEEEEEDAEEEEGLLFKANAVNWLTGLSIHWAGVLTDLPAESLHMEQEVTACLTTGAVGAPNLSYVPGRSVGVARLQAGGFAATMPPAIAEKGPHQIGAVRLFL